VMDNDYLTQHERNLQGCHPELCLLRGVSAFWTAALGGGHPDKVVLDMR
jgi:hypothetical protein